MVDVALPGERDSEFHQRAPEADRLVERPRELPTLSSQLGSSLELALEVRHLRSAEQHLVPNPGRAFGGGSQGIDPPPPLTDEATDSPVPPDRRGDSELLLGLARPEATVADPQREGTVVLAFDVSRSMAAKDITPTRMEAAKAAARAFVQRQPAEIKVGVVAFSDSGVVTQRPTAQRSQVLAAINRLTPSGATALGRGIQTSLSAIAGKPVLLIFGSCT